MNKGPLLKRDAWVNAVFFSRKRQCSLRHSKRGFNRFMTKSKAGIVYDYFTCIFGVFLYLATAFALFSHGKFLFTFLPKGTQVKTALFSDKPTSHVRTVISLRLWFWVLKSKMSCTPWVQVAKWWIHSACGGPLFMKFRI